MNDDWWPDLLRHISEEKPWDDEKVTVAELRSYREDPWMEGARTLYTALIRIEDLERLDGKLIGFNYDVETTGPGPAASSAGQYTPEFYISALFGDERIKCEPLVLSWEANNRTAMMISPGFLMTYGLIPRTLDDGSMHWDDLEVPEFSIAIVDAPSIYDYGVHSGARVRIERDHLQDYLTMRGMALVQVYHESRRGGRDEAAEAVLGDQVQAVFKLSDREVDVRRRDGGGYIAQIWGARVIARPKDLPISVDPLEAEGLVWPGIEGAVTHQVARQFRPWDNVFIRDSVLAAYEGQAGFSVHPETGGVSYGHQWGIGPAARVGRDVIRVEVRKLYEGSARRAIQHWNEHAITPTPDLLDPEARSARNIGQRSHDLVYALAALGQRLAALGDLLDLPHFNSADVAGVARYNLDREGWWNAPHVEPITRHIPLNMDRAAFLDRCVALSKFMIEALAQRHLRAMMNGIGEQPDKTAQFAALKLLDRIISLAQVANDAGLTLWDDGQEITDRLAQGGTEPALPLDVLFALNDLRQAGAHRKDEADKLIGQATSRFGIDLRTTSSGWGAALDIVYDRLIEQLEQLSRTLDTALNL